MTDQETPTRHPVPGGYWAGRVVLIVALLGVLATAVVVLALASADEAAPVPSPTPTAGVTP
ncbi:hypothetical protein OG792_05755 [Micromonospora sp. NBC_01699]|uniref:hypothetical protein n=1 Tax=Micromonospora sp. NBC_01699 TaxID=2975984 RepID=UPI002E2F1E32|nr:hypothetical protein [Micromonospora sp. NBC_01699]